MAEILAPTPESLERAVAALRAGELVAFPTETVYGLGADARNEAAVGRVFAAKGRPAEHPLIVHLAGAAELPLWADPVPPEALALAARFWPGPLTLILPRAAGVPDAVTGGQPTVGLRVPGHPLAEELLRRFGGGLAAPSANRFGRISPTRAEHVADELGERVRFVLDGGPCRVGLESSIVDLSGDAPRLLRPGGVARAALEAALGRPLGGADAGAPRAPGTLASHYAPRTPTFLVATAAAGDVGTAVISRRAAPAGHAGAWRRLPDDPEGYGRALYGALRDLDAAGAQRILVERVPEAPAWEAVADRLRRAARPAEEPGDARP